MKLPATSAEPATAEKPTAMAAAPVPVSAAQPAPADPVEAIPQHGGSYVREPDGSLTRVEFTKHPDETEEQV